jgi:hypothetical protein
LKEEIMKTYEEQRAIALYYESHEKSIAVKLVYTDKLYLEDVRRSTKGTECLELLVSPSEHPSFILGPENATAEVVENVTPKNIKEVAVRTCGINVNTHNWSYLIDLDSALVVQAYQKTIQELKSTISDQCLPIIGSLYTTLFYLTCRLYDELAERGVWVLHKEKSAISSLLIARRRAATVGMMRIADEDSSRALKMLYKELDKRQQPHILLSGRWSAEEIAQLPSWEITSFDFSNWQYLKINPEIAKKVPLLGAELAPAIGAALMSLEGIGINLDATGEQPPLNYIPDEWLLAPRERILGKLVAAVKLIGQRVTEAAREQKTIFATVALLMLGWPAVSYYQKVQTTNDLNRRQASAANTLTALSGIKKDYDTVKAKQQAVAEAKKVLYEIRQRQNLVQTAVYEVNTQLPSGISFTELEVMAHQVAIKGVATEKAAVFEFGNRLASRRDNFESVAPIYDEKSGNQSWAITATYIGQVPVNTLPNNKLSTPINLVTSNAVKTVSATKENQ